MDLIEADGRYGSSRDYDASFYQDDREEITNLLVGKKVSKVAEDHLILDDGTLLKFVGNDGGCACSAGCYPLTELNGVDNIITNVEFYDNPSSDYGDDGEGFYKIFVFADNVKVNLATFEGSDGNGYYGTGYGIYVRFPRLEVKVEDAP